MVVPCDVISGGEAVGEGISDTTLSGLTGTVSAGDGEVSGTLTSLK